MDLTTAQDIYDNYTRRVGEAKGASCYPANMLHEVLITGPCSRTLAQHGFHSGSLMLRTGVPGYSTNLADVTPTDEER